MKEASFFDRLNAWARSSVTLKLFVIGILILILLIPGSMITSLIYERENIRDSAVQEVSSKWGLNQTVGGPVISVPYETVQLNSEGKAITSTGYAHFLPDDLFISGTIAPEKRYRGIYVVVLYNARLAISGKFGPLNAAALTIPEESLRWEDALFTLGISDMKGVESSIDVELNDTIHSFGPGTVTNDIFASGANLPLGLRQRPDSLNFSFELSLNGSSDLFFMPFGKETVANIRSSWADPSFEGAFLPDEREVTADGFQASWTVLQLNRNYAQQGTGPYVQSNEQPFTAPNRGYNADSPFRAQTNAFGVRLLLPIDEYQKTMRSAKYATFFIFITFLTFFFIEILNRKRLHPIQYLLVGAAIILFYILLLSISEHLRFDWAYLISCLIILSLITGYSSYILKNRHLTLLIGGILAVLYGFFYSLLQLQDYALLLGSIGLLAILATIMYLTRSIDWYDLQRGRDYHDAAEW